MANDKVSNNTSLETPLGREVGYPSEYDASLLFPVPRKDKRIELGFSGGASAGSSNELPFHGGDFWNAYEISWLNAKGKPQVAVGVFEFAFDTENIIESKSFKLYLNSYNQTRFKNWQEVQQRLSDDLSVAVKGSVSVKLYSLVEYRSKFPVIASNAVLIDDLDVEIDTYDYQPELLVVEPSGAGAVEESLHSDLLKSNCLITSQPDWASVVIDYKGQKINHESLLKYLISFRNHNEFHEQCVERIFTDIMTHCSPEKLTVYARYTRRGGLDINPWRSNVVGHLENNYRLVRQ